MTRHEPLSLDKESHSSIVSVSRPGAGLPNWALYTLAGFAGLGIFSVLASQRDDPDEANSFDPVASSVISSPPPLVIPDGPDMGLGPAEQLALPRNQAPTFIPAPPPRTAPRSSSATTQAVQYLPPELPSTPSAWEGDTSTFAFAPPASDVLPDPVPALVLDRGVSRMVRSANGRDPKRYLGPGKTDSGASQALLRPEPAISGRWILAAGSMIPAVLQVPIDTAQGGPVIAIVSRDVRGEDGREIVVPKGTKLFGEYPSGAQASGKRVLITWRRLLLPDGREVGIDFPASDSDGAPGVKGEVHTNALGRFADSVLRTVVNAATFGLINRAASDTVIIGSPLNGAVQGGENRPSRRITVEAGTMVRVFVVRPIDFTPGSTP